MNNETLCELLQTMEQGRYAAAHAILRGEREVLSDMDAEICLNAALQATPGIFRRIVQLCEPREYSGKTDIDLPDGSRIFVSGTMLTIAAALNKPDHVKVLLEAGYDPNSAGVSSAAAFNPLGFYIMDGHSDYGDRSGVGGNLVSCSGKHRWSIRCATPLAAAVACGSAQAVSVLMRCPEVWKVESGVVCRAAVAALMTYQGDPRQAVAWQIFGRRNPAYDAERLLTTCDLQIEYSADFCSAELMRLQVEHGFCDEAGARKILSVFEENRLMARSLIRARIRKLELMEQYFPELCRESWATGVFLRELVRRYTPQRPHRKLMAQWKQLCGEEGDLTWVDMELYRMPRPHLQALLKELEQDMRLIMDADAFFRFDKSAKGELMDLLTHVQLRHNRGLDGVSSLVSSLVRMGDLRFLRKAARLGAFAGEDPAVLLKYLRDRGREDLRALVLTYSGPAAEEEPPRWMEECREGYWKRDWGILPSGYETWIQELGNRELSREECLRRLQMMNWSGFVDGPWHSQWQFDYPMEGHLRRQAVLLSQPVAAICCGAQKQPLELMLTFMPEKLKQRYAVHFGDFQLMDLEGTPLTLAAATGRTELVKLLLEAGVDPDERGIGMVSVLRAYQTDTVPVTPVMAAIYYGEEETAKLLLEAGAECDFSKHAFRELLRRGDQETAAVAARLPGVKFETVPKGFLESLREEELCF